jgi:histidinol-phosphate aminotransferase
VKKTVDLIVKEKDFLYKELNSMGVRFIPSEANFILVNVGMDSRVLFRRMLEKGIITRPGDIWNLPRFVRLTVGTREQNTRFLDALKEIRASGNS